MDAKDKTMKQKIRKRRRRRSRSKLVRKYAENMPGTLLGVFWKEFKDLLQGQSGVYVLYKNDVPHYVGKASRLASRVRNHLKDRVISMGRRNTCSQFTCGSFKTQGFSRALI